MAQTILPIQRLKTNDSDLYRFNSSRLGLIPNIFTTLFSLCLLLFIVWNVQSFFGIDAYTYQRLNILSLSPQEVLKLNNKKEKSKVEITFAPTEIAPTTATTLVTKTTRFDPTTAYQTRVSGDYTYYLSSNCNNWENPNCQIWQRDNFNGGTRLIQNNFFAGIKKKMGSISAGSSITFSKHQDAHQKTSSDRKHIFINLTQDDPQKNGFHLIQIPVDSPLQNTITKIKKEDKKSFDKFFQT